MRALYTLLIVFLINGLSYSQSIDLVSTHLFPNEGVGIGDLFHFKDTLTGKNYVLADVDQYRYLAKFEVKEDRFEIVNSKFIHTSPGYDRHIFFEDVSGDSQKDLILFDENGYVFVIDPYTFKSKDTINLDINFPIFNYIAFEDIDGDGKKEWICAKSGELYFLDGTSFEVLFLSVNGQLGAEKVFVDDFDGDGQIEIMLYEEGDISIINAETGGLEYSFETNFATKLEKYDVNNDGATDILMTNQNVGVEAFDVVSGQLIHTFEIPGNDYRNLEVGKLLDKERNVLAISSTQLGEVWMIDLDNKSLIWKKADLIGSLYNFIKIEITSGLFVLLLSEGANSTGFDNLRLLNPVDGTLIFDYDHVYEPIFSGVKPVGEDGRMVGTIFYERANSFGERFEYRINSFDQLFKRQIGRKLGKSEIFDFDLLNYGNFRNPTFPDILFNDRSTDFFIMDIVEKTYSKDLEISNVSNTFHFDIDTDGLDELIVSENNGKIAVYDIRDEGSSIKSFTSLEPIASGVKSIRPIQYDDDRFLELLIATSGKVIIFDLQNEQELFSFEPNAFSGFRDAVFYSRPSDQKDMLMIASDQGLVQYNLNENTFLQHTNGIENIRKLEVIFDEYFDHFLVILGNGVRLASLDTFKLIEDKLVFENENLQMKSSHLIDLDKNMKLNILGQVHDQVFNFELSFPSMTVKPLWINNILSKTDNDSININSELIFQTNDASISVEDFAAHITLLDPDSSNVDVEITKLDNALFKISPISNTWPANQTIRGIISNPLHGSSTSFLDGNFDNQYQQGADDYEFVIHTLDIIDRIGPKIKLLGDPLLAIVKGVKKELIFDITEDIDGSGIIENIAVAVDEHPVLDLENRLFPIDRFWDEKSEQFKLLLNSSNYDVGAHELHLVAYDHSKNAGDTLSIPFIVLENDIHAFESFGYNTSHTGFVEYSNISFPFEHLYTTDINGSRFEPIPVIWKKYMAYTYIIQQDHKLDIIDYTDGSVIKTFTYFDISQPAIYDGQLYFTYAQLGGGGGLVAYDLESQEIIWETTIINQWAGQNSPVVSEDILFIETGAVVELGAFDRWNGKELWTRKVKHEGGWSPVVWNDSAYVFLDNRMYKFDFSGNLFLEKSYQNIDLPLFQLTAPILDTSRKQIIISHREGFAGIDIFTFEVNWTRNFGVFDKTICLLKKDEIIAFHYDNVLKLNPWTGETIDSISLPGDLRFTPIVNQAIVFVPGEEDLMLVDVKDFELKNILPYTGHVSIHDSIVVLNNLDSLIVLKAELNCFEFNNIEIDLCSGDTVKVGPFEYFAPGVYQDTIFTVGIECSEINTVHVQELPPILIANEFIAADNGTGNGSIIIEVIGAPPFDFQWSNGATSTFNTNISAGNYSLIITDANGCEANYIFTVPLNTATINNSDFNKSWIEPNIVKQGQRTRLKINDPTTHQADLIMYNAQGIMLERSVIDLNFGSENSIDLVSEYPAGLYFIRISDGSQLNQLLKLIIQ